jgi:predicted Rossmann-fold nucleotide-binding protein
LDELMEILTLAQTNKLECKVPIILYGPDYWNEIINFQALVRHGMIAREDLGLFQFADDPPTAFDLLTSALEPSDTEKTPAFRRSRCQS